MVDILLRLRIPFMLLPLIAGCSVHREYDFSTVAPFSSFSGKDVRLVRAVSLIEGQHLGSERKNYSIHFAFDEGRPKARDTIYWKTRALPLPAGTSVHVANTLLYYDRQSIFQAYFETAYLFTVVEINLSAPGWPEHVTAMFDNSDDFFPSPFKGRVRSAPWNPITISIGFSPTLSDERYRVKEKN